MDAFESGFRLIPRSLFSRPPWRILESELWYSYDILSVEFTCPWCYLSIALSVSITANKVRRYNMDWPSLTIACRPGNCGSQEPSKNPKRIDRLEAKWKKLKQETGFIEFQQ